MGRLDDIEKRNRAEIGRGYMRPTIDPTRAYDLRTWILYPFVAIALLGFFGLIIYAECVYDPNATHGR